MKQRVLLVEDDQWLGEQFAHVLQKAGFETVHVLNGVAGMDAIDIKRPDAIVLDMFMPGPNGLVLLHELQSHSDLSAIPVILCSNSSADIGDQELHNYGVRVVLDKTTMESADLVSAVRKVLP